MEGEHKNLIVAAKKLSNWKKDEMRLFKSITNRDAPARKALERLVYVPLDNLVAYISEFSKFKGQNDGNRMKDAKDFRKDHKLKGTDMLNILKVVEFPLRGFNTVMFENKDLRI